MVKMQTADPIIIERPAVYRRVTGAAESAAIRVFTRIKCGRRVTHAEARWLQRAAAGTGALPSGLEKLDLGAWSILVGRNAAP